MPDSILDRLNSQRVIAEGNVRDWNTLRNKAKIDVRSAEFSLKKAKRELYRANLGWVLERKRLARIVSKIKTLPSYLRSQSKRNSGKVLNKILGGD